MCEGIDFHRCYFSGCLAPIKTCIVAPSHVQVLMKVIAKKDGKGHVAEKE